MELSKENRGITAAQATALVAVMSLIGAGLGAGITGYFTKVSSIGVEEQRSDAAIQLEREKFEIGLILKAVETNDPRNAVPVLKFYAQAGLIPTYEIKILSLAERNEGRDIPVTSLQVVTQESALLAQRVVAASEEAITESKGDTPGFVRAVAARFGVNLPGTADQIVDAIQQKDWEILADGIAAAARARAGYLVVAGLKGSDQAVPVKIGFVAIVVDGPLSSGKYPTAYWERWNETARSKTINWVWNSQDRDRVIYAARPLEITAAQ